MGRNTAPHYRDEDISTPWFTVEREVTAAHKEQRMPDPHVLLSALAEAADNGYVRGYGAGQFAQGMREAHCKSFEREWKHDPDRS